MFSIMNGSSGFHNCQFGWALHFSTTLWICLQQLPFLIRHTFTGYHSAGLEVWVLLCCLLQPHHVCLVDVEISSFSTSFTKRFYFSSGTTYNSEEILSGFLCTEFLKIVDMLDLWNLLSRKLSFYVLVNALISLKNVPTSKNAECCCTSESEFNFFVTFNSNSRICWVLVLYCALILDSSKNVFSRLD